MAVRVIRCSGRGEGLVGWMSQQQMVRPILALVSYSLLPTAPWGYFVLLPWSQVLQAPIQVQPLHATCVKIHPWFINMKKFYELKIHRPNGHIKFFRNVVVWYKLHGEYVYTGSELTIKAYGVPEVPLPHSCLAHLTWDPSNIKGSGCPQILIRSIIYNVTGNIVVDPHGEILFQCKQFHGVPCSIINNLVAAIGDYNQSVNYCMSYSYVWMVVTLW